MSQTKVSEFWGKVLTAMVADIITILIIAAVAALFGYKLIWPIVPR